MIDLSQGSETEQGSGGKRQVWRNQRYETNGYGNQNVFHSQSIDECMQLVKLIKESVNGGII